MWFENVLRLHLFSLEFIYSAATCTLLAPHKNKKPCKSMTYRNFKVAGGGPEPSTSGL